MTIYDLIAKLQNMVKEQPELGNYKVLAKVKTLGDWGIAEMEDFRIQPMDGDDSFVVISGTDAIK